MGFRFFAEREAAVRNLVGYVRNLRDGDVEVVVEGPRAALEDLLAVLTKGPRAARVDRIVPVWGGSRGEFREFGIRF